MAASSESGIYTSPKTAQVEQVKQLTNTESSLQRYVHTSQNMTVIYVSYEEQHRWYQTKLINYNSYHYYKYKVISLSLILYL